MWIYKTCKLLTSSKLCWKIVHTIHKPSHFFVIKKPFSITLILCWKLLILVFPVKNNKSLTMLPLPLFRGAPFFSIWLLPVSVLMNGADARLCLTLLCYSYRSVRDASGRVGNRKSIPNPGRILKVRNRILAVKLKFRFRLSILCAFFFFICEDKCDLAICQDLAR